MSDGPRGAPGPSAVDPSSRATRTPSPVTAHLGRARAETNVDAALAQGPRPPARLRTAPPGARSRGNASTRVTRVPRLAHAWASSTPTTPPPRITSEARRPLGRRPLAVVPRRRTRATQGSAASAPRAAGGHHHRPLGHERVPRRRSGPGVRRRVARDRARASIALLVPARAAASPSESPWITSSRRRSTAGDVETAEAASAAPGTRMSLVQRLGRAQQGFGGHARPVARTRRPRAHARRGRPAARAQPGDRPSPRRPVRPPARPRRSVARPPSILFSSVHLSAGRADVQYAGTAHGPYGHPGAADQPRRGRRPPPGSRTVRHDDSDAPTALRAVARRPVPADQVRRAPRRARAHRRSRRHPARISGARRDGGHRSRPLRTQPRASVARAAGAARRRSRRGHGPNARPHSQRAAPSGRWPLSTDDGPIDVDFEPPATAGHLDLFEGARRHQLTPRLAVELAALADLVRIAEMRRDPPDEALLALLTPEIRSPAVSRST